MTAFEEFYDELVTSRPTFEQNQVKLFKLLESCFQQDPNIISIEFTGYTPGFNDGDPCTHSEYVEFEMKKSTKVDKKVEKILMYQDLTEYVWETDFLVKVSLNEEGVLVVNHEHYDCGY